jgi:hypothetical protein
MMDCGCAHGGQAGRINGSTLKKHLGKQAGHPFGPIGRKAWVEICPSCHVRWLKMDEQHSLPFLDADGLMRTAANEAGTASAEVLEFAGFRFTLAALRSAIALQAREFRTREVEEYGARLPKTLSPEQASAFSKLVCDWGGGGRVWGKLKAGNEGDPGAAIARWLNAVAAGELDDEEAIDNGCAIAGLGVSFASKHLRMLQPHRFAVLDDVLCVGFGFALNRKGFAFFLRELRVFQRALRERFGLDIPVATLEAGLFMLVRQGVRARPWAAQNDESEQPQ